MINNETSLYISASYKPGNFGATIYNSLFKKYDINAVYLPRKVSDAQALIDSLKTLDVKGCSVSMPLKSTVIEYLDNLDDIAYETNSVNTIVSNNGELTGYNADYYGVREVLTSANADKVLIYGSGSVVNSIILALKSLNSKAITICARNIEKARNLAKKHAISAANINELERNYDLLVNATPASMETPEHELFGLLKLSNNVFDLVVSPVDTPFIKMAKEQNYKTIVGIEMCKYQLQKQFEFYLKFQPDISDIEEAIKLYLK